MGTLTEWVGEKLLLAAVFLLIPVGLLLMLLSFYSSVPLAIAERWIGTLMAFVGVLFDGLIIYTGSQ